MDNIYVRYLEVYLMKSECELIKTVITKLFYYQEVRNVLFE